MHNLSGGIKAWNGETAVGGEALGIQLFSGQESIAQTLTVAYSLEQGLRDFYLSMTREVAAGEAKALFTKLADIEIKHQEKIFKEYLKVDTNNPSQEEFEQNIVVAAVEGGLTTEEFVATYKPDRESAVEIAAMAMAIEAQALDLYMRAADRATDEDIKKSLAWIASEEQAHMRELGKLIDSIG